MVSFYIVVYIFSVSSHYVFQVLRVRYITVRLTYYEVLWGSSSAVSAAR
jgi:hypothetical protein